jgi:tetratricopeptide (TPR) repeat protein
MGKSNEEFAKNNYDRSIEYLLDAWDKLPEPKVIYGDSFHIARDISETYLLVNDFKNADTWSQVLFRCSLQRVDVGERDFLAGKIAFESGDREEALKFFKKADEKSEGRCFEDEDIKYKEFFKNGG